MPPDGAIQHDNALGMLSVVTTDDCDGNGHKTRAVTAHCAGASGRALFTSRSSTRNALGHTETRTHDPRRVVGAVVGAQATQVPAPKPRRWRWPAFSA